MTSHHIDLRVVPDPETSAPQLLGALYDRLHLALVERRCDGIGVSFPGYSLNPHAIGNVLRLHGSEAELRQLMGVDWLKGVRDHVSASDLVTAPVDVPHRSVRRKQFKTSAERLRRRRMKRKGETAEQAARAIPPSVERNPDLPYLRVHSRSTGQPYCMFIQLGPASAAPVSGIFNSYGLSNKATIPWF